jgi:hypothetical protein
MVKRNFVFSGLFSCDFDVPLEDIRLSPIKTAFLNLAGTASALYPQLFKPTHNTVMEI